MSDGATPTPPPYDPTQPPAGQQFPPPGGQQFPPPNPAGAPPAQATGSPVAPGYSYGAPPPTSAPEEKKSRKWPWIILLLVLLPILGIGGCVAVLYRAGAAPVNATNDFLALLDEDRNAEAYASMIEDCSVMDEATFVEVLETIDITGYKIDSVSVQSSTGQQSTATTGGTVEIEGAAHDAQFELRKVDDTWQVCRFDISQDPVTE
ncbi:MAG: hypothetical protein ACRBI6_03550 [Acidimicrobiales bacterium]